MSVDADLDLLVRLYDLPDTSTIEQELAAAGISIRRALAAEQRHVLAWVTRKFGPNWADECRVAFGTHPIRCFVATCGPDLLAFSVYDATAKGTAGPLGKGPEVRAPQLGKVMLATALRDMRAQGYQYAVLGWIAPVLQRYFRREFHAMPITASTPTSGMYAGLLRTLPESSE